MKQLDGKKMLEDPETHVKGFCIEACTERHLRYDAQGEDTERTNLKPQLVARF